MKVALYARVSTKRQEKKGTIASQIEALRNYAREHKYVIAKDYVCKDDGYSGASLARPELDRLRDGAQAAAFDAILVLSPDRLSRKYAYLILMLEEFERFGIPVIFLEQPPPDDPHSSLLVQIQGAVAEYERAKLAERYRRGKLYRARQGEVFWASIPYGYRRVPRQDSVPAHLVINEAEAEVVRKIFSWHAHETMTIRQIAKRLTREEIPTPKGGRKWGETTVHRILHREAYLGTLYYNRSSYVFQPATDRKSACIKKIPKPRAEWIPLNPKLLLKAQGVLNNTPDFDESFLSTQLQNAKKRLTQVQEERHRLIDLYQGGFVTKEEFDQRACKVSKRIDSLQADVAALEQEHQNVSEKIQLLTRISDFTSVITQKLDRMTFHDKQDLARRVLKEVVINGDVVKLYFKIPLPKSKKHSPEPVDDGPQYSLSSNLNLRSRCGAWRRSFFRSHPMDSVAIQVPAASEGAQQGLLR